MPKLKSKKSCTKRISINKNGVVKHGVSFKRHGMFGRSNRRTRKHGTQTANKAMMLVVKNVFPYSAIRLKRKKSIINQECISCTE
jgi:large subunit ribosomal protein L35